MYKAHRPLIIILCLPNYSTYLLTNHFCQKKLYFGRPLKDASYQAKCRRKNLQRPFEFDPIIRQKCAAPGVKVFTHGSLASLQRRASACNSSLIAFTQDFPFHSSTLCVVLSFDKTESDPVRISRRRFVYFAKVCSRASQLNENTQFLCRPSICK